MSDNVASTLTDVTSIQVSWTTKRLSLENTFFIVCPSFIVIHNLLILGQIYGEDFSLFIDHWDQIHGGMSHNLKYKMSASLIDLPLVFWYPF